MDFYGWRSPITIQLKDDVENMTTLEIIDSGYLSEIYVTKLYFDKYAYENNLPFGLQKDMVYKKAIKSLKKQDGITINNDLEYEVDILYTGLHLFREKRELLLSYTLGTDRQGSSIA